MHSSRRVERAGLWWLVCLLLAGGVLAVLGLEARDARQKVAREDEALAAVRALLQLSEAQRKQSGRYVWLEDLGGAGALPFATVVGAQGLEARTPGYRLQILLPTGRDPGGAVLLAPAGASVDVLLAARHMAVVARPLVPGVDGYRSFYADETGRIFVQEGAVDAEGLRESALPRARLERPSGAESPGPVWRLLEDLDRGS